MPSPISFSSCKILLNDIVIGVVLGRIQILYCLYRNTNHHQLSNLINYSLLKLILAIDYKNQRLPERIQIRCGTSTTIVFEKKNQTLHNIFVPKFNRFIVYNNDGMRIYIEISGMRGLT